MKNDYCLSLVLLALFGMSSPYSAKAFTGDNIPSTQSTLQAKKITGKVMDATGEPIIGASVLVKGTGTGTVTNVDGNFSVDAQQGSTLVISFVGYTSAEIKVGAGSIYNVTLADDTQALEEVVVTAMGIKKERKSLGYAVDDVNAKELMKNKSTNAINSLAGKVAGVTITQTSGAAGAGSQIILRGGTSLERDNQPLFVVDGVIYDNSTSIIGNSAYDGMKASATTGSNRVMDINPEDIENMSILKGPAASALYGSRAANGVIVITTKKGASGKTKINLRADWGLSNMAINYRPILNGEDRREILHLGLANYALNNGNDETAAKAFADKNIEDFAARPWSGYTDWKDVLFRNGSHQNYEVSAQGGSEKTRFYTSFAYTKQEGITNVSGYERFTGRANVTHQANRLTLEANTMFTNSTQNVNNEGTSFASPIMCYAMTASPSTYPYNEDGSFSTNFPALNGANPIQTEAYNYNRSTINRFLGSLSATWNIWDNLNIKEVVSYDFNQNNERVWWDPRSNDGRSSNGVYQRVMGNRAKLNTQTQLTYNKVIAEKHTLDALIGFETEDYKYDYVYANGNTYPSYLPEIENAGNTRASSSVQRYRMTSFLGRLNYDYENKYYFSASFRRDGSSRLSRESRWGDFWSVSGSWRITSESFMENIKEVITDAKLRASYGVNGTQPSDYYGYLGVFGFGYNYNKGAGSAENRIENPNMKWEKNYATNIGLDLTLWNRLALTFEWYNRETKDLLMDRAISAVPGIIDGSGIANTLMNVGSMRNRGFEFEIKSTNIQNNNLTWTTTFNISHNKNKLTKLDGEQNEMISGVSIHRIGEPYYSIYAYEYAGVDPATGKELYYINGEDGSRETTTNSAQANKTIIGSVEPTVQGGLTNFVSWKFIDFNMTLTYSLGGHAYDYATWLQSNGGTYNYLGNVPAYYKIEDTWKKPGDNAKLPQFAYGNTNIASSRWLMSTDHLRIKNITLGFTMPSKVSQKWGINKLRAFVSANNLLTWKSDGLYVDPETPVDGLCTFETPALRTITFGLEVGF